MCQSARAQMDELLLHYRAVGNNFIFKKLMLHFTCFNKQN